MHAAITRPLAPGDRTQRRWTDGRATEKVFSSVIKPSATLEPIERLEIYNRMYWFRIQECFSEDSPGLRAFLGEERFWKLADAYLARYPSHSFSLRNLCSNLVRFLADEPSWTAPHTDAALDIARFEWAQIVAFDGLALKPLSKKQIQTIEPEKLRVRVQPYVSVLTLSYAVDEYVMAVKRGDAGLRGEASQAVVSRKGRKSSAADRGLKKEAVEVAVHRSENQLYYKRLTPEAAAILRNLAAGQPVATACTRAMRGSKLSPQKQVELIQRWFALWMRLGWLCPRE